MHAMTYEPVQARQGWKDSARSSRDLLQWLMHRMTPQAPEAPLSGDHRQWRV